jgi:hypothetical protein
MKVAMNGELNLSVLDGWWAEAWDANGWDRDPGRRCRCADRHDAVRRDLLENEIVPLLRSRYRGCAAGWMVRVASVCPGATLHEACHGIRESHVRAMTMTPRVRHNRVSYVSVVIAALAFIVFVFL